MFTSRSGIVVIIVLLTVTAIGVGITWHAILLSEEFDEQNTNANAVAAALLRYKASHGGSLPRSLDSLKIKDEPASDMAPAFKANISSFRLLPPGCRSGERNLDVIIEASEVKTWACWQQRLGQMFPGIFPKLPDGFVRIYSDGEVRHETSAGVLSY